MYRMRQILSTLIIYNLLIINLLAQHIEKNYFRQPLGGTLLVSGNFGEFRTNHFHAGLDFRTGTIGKPVYAPADGYVSRINVSGGGYGNALYLTHPHGYKTVYGHLTRFAPEIQQWFRQKQEETSEFRLDLELDSSIFPVKKGQIIAYTGNTGRSGGPHLHFEIRNLNDEPLNPQLFGFRIRDTKPPEIKKIAVYPADDFAYVNNSHNSLVIPVEYGNINKSIIVHGNIYFGIEAFDYLNDVGSRNAIYSTKLFIDGKLIYYSRFDSISYENTRDINSMVDYKRRKLKGYRIQRCYVEPNNELFHYQTVVDNGVVNFNDNALHEVKFIVKDVYGNATSLKFNVQSTTRRKNFGIKHDSTYFFRYDTINIYNEPGIEVFLPEKSLFDNIFFNFYTTTGNEYSPVYHINSEFVPLKNYIIVSINITSVPEKYRDKTVICRKDYEGDISCYTGSIDNNYLSIFTRSFGNYYIDIDSTAPYIRPINIANGRNMASKSRINIKITDDLSGINDFAGFVNGQWVLFTYDAKRDLLSYRFDEKTKKGKNTLKLLVCDAVGNIATYSVVFYR